MMSWRRRSWLATSVAPCCFAVAAALLSARPCAGQTSAKVPTGVAKRDIVKKTTPAYPLPTSASGMQGTLVLGISVGKDGKVRNGYFLTGPPLLAWKAISAVGKWRIRPSSSGGTPGAIGVIVATTMTFWSSKAWPPKMSSAVPVAVANEHVVKQVAPAYPTVARAKGIQGVVVLDVSIGTDGKVESGYFLTGPPLLAWPAVQAVSKWRFRPFLVDGTPRKVNTVVEITFAPGPSKAGLAKELDERMAYSVTLVRCLSLLSSREYDEAGKACNRLPKLAEALPAASYAERVDANHYAGLAGFDLGDYDGSVAEFQQEVSGARSYLKGSWKLNIAPSGPGLTGMVEGPAEFELGRAYGDLAAALSDEGKFKEAAPEYKRAISVFEHQRRAVLPREEKDHYEKVLEPLLRQYADVLRKTGRTRDAAKAMRKAAKLAGQIQK